NPDGESLAAIDVAGRLSVWSIATGQIVRNYAPQLEEGTQQSPYDVHAFLVFAPDGKQVLGGMNRGTYCRPLFLWEVATGKEIRRMDGAAQGFISAAVSADFKTLAAVGQDRRIIFWNVASGKQLRQGPALDKPLLTLAFAPDG